MFKALTFEPTSDQFGENERKETEKEFDLLKEKIEKTLGFELKSGHSDDPNDPINCKNKVRNRVQRTLRLLNLDAPFVILHNEIRMTKEAIERLEENTEMKLR